MKQYSVKAITQLTGVNEHTLRTWERRYNIVEPGRGENGRRIYSAGDLDRILMVHQLVDAGHPVSALARLDDNGMRRLLAETQKVQDHKSSEPLRDVSGEGAQQPMHRDQVKTMLHDLLNYDLGALAQELRLAAMQWGVRDYLLDGVIPLMYEVGRMVLEERMTIAQEHLVSSTIRFHLGELYTSMAPRAQRGRSRLTPAVIISSPEGHLHEIGILTAAILCQLQSIPVHYLGPHIPASSLRALAQELGVRHVILGVTDIPSGLLPQPMAIFLRDLVPAGSPFRVIVGGRMQGVTEMEESFPHVTFVKTLRQFDQQLLNMLR